MPGPSRTVAHPWQLPGNNEVEHAKCYTDNVLLYRMILLQVVAQKGRDVRLSQNPKVQPRPEGEVLVGAAG